MKSRIMKLFFSTAATLVLMVFVAGCATTGMQRSENTSTKMKIVEQDIENAAAQVDMTRASLEELFRPGQADVKKAFELYSDNVAKMEELGKKFLNHTAGMSNQGKQYFEEWRKENNAYTDPEIQALSEQRRSDLSGIFDQIAESSVGVKGSLETYLTETREIQTYLANDMTPRGFDAINAAARKALNDGDKLKQDLKPVLSAIANASAEMKQGGNTLRNN